MNSNPSDTLSLSTSTAAPLDVVHDPLNAQDKCEKAYQDYQRERLQARRKQFHDRIPRMKLKTFSSIKKQWNSKTVNKHTIQKGDHRLFGHMVLQLAEISTC